MLRLFVIKNSNNFCFNLGKEFRKSKVIKCIETSDSQELKPLPVHIISNPDMTSNSTNSTIYEFFNLKTNSTVLAALGTDKNNLELYSIYKFGVNYSEIIDKDIILRHVSTYITKFLNFQHNLLFV